MKLFQQRLNETWVSAMYKAQKYTKTCSPQDSVHDEIQAIRRIRFANTPSLTVNRMKAAEVAKMMGRHIEPQ